mmetsp:Transcript_9731/g.14361  ORF Transcript_9731/g.14361 Transcript_9731/m.14361 type:complete len:302 (-) Transcript_9731:21-926(-)|eukprot:CAMPEP_0117418616 /NCGR_PEP_ID=MMETSP0758-20121206/350_1 /TAXON_ID=63605 /ORGANISM="Percolomonas cosmopolitus, Strain AE-1 (ATCC 50343)" /LENGTH=301 /DNA_ID=CAMNT_0005199203 /DNA_START=10 /DNA_END=915 /DNA_ORIENTATION=+
MKVIIALAILFAAVIAVANAQSILEEALFEVMAESMGTTTCTVTANSLSFRSGAGTKYRILRYLSNGARVTFVADASYANGHNWKKVSYNGQTGYVAATYLRCSTDNNNNNGGGKSKCSQSTKLKDSLRMIFSSEGKCQNWSSDSGNWMNGKLGYTCAGIIPSVGYNNRNLFSYASSCLNGPSHLFVKCAWDKSNSKFNDAAAKIYEKQYAIAGGCANLPQPAYYVCFDIAVNSGPGRSKQFIREFGGYNGNPIDFATKLNERHRSFYISISQPGSKNHKFRAGWLRRADHRKQYIASCKA